jgi:hypothetical protein
MLDMLNLQRGLEFITTCIFLNTEQQNEYPVNYMYNYVLIWCDKSALLCLGTFSEHLLHGFEVLYRNLLTTIYY